MNETQFTTNSPPTFFQQNYNLTGVGVPVYQLGVNALPGTAVPPITTAYQTPKGTNLFAIETNGKKPREYMWNFSLQKSFGANAFSQTPALRLGTSGRDIIASPGFANLDMSLFKNFYWRERASLQFRAEFFNALNHPRFDPPNLDSSSPFFGQIQAAEAPRIIQLGLRIQF
jgi:hypothetical protein